MSDFDFFADRNWAKKAGVPKGEERRLLSSKAQIRFANLNSCKKPWKNEGKPAGDQAARGRATWTKVLLSGASKKYPINAEKLRNQVLIYIIISIKVRNIREYWHIIYIIDNK